MSESSINKSIEALQGYNNDSSNKILRVRGFFRGRHLEVVDKTDLNKPWGKILKFFGFFNLTAVLKEVGKVKGENAEVVKTFVKELGERVASEKSKKNTRLQSVWNGFLKANQSQDQEQIPKETGDTLGTKEDVTVNTKDNKQENLGNTVEEKEEIESENNSEVEISDEYSTDEHDSSGDDDLNIDVSSKEEKIVESSLPQKKKNVGETSGKNSNVGSEQKRIEAPQTQKSLAPKEVQTLAKEIEQRVEYFLQKAFGKNYGELELDLEPMKKYLKETLEYDAKYRGIAPQDKDMQEETLFSIYYLTTHLTKGLDGVQCSYAPSKDDGDCFFDSVAQGLEKQCLEVKKDILQFVCGKNNDLVLFEELKNSIEKIEGLLAEVYVNGSLDIQKLLENRHMIPEKYYPLFERGVDELMILNAILEDNRDYKEGAKEYITNLTTKTTIWGRASVEGKIVARIYGVCLHEFQAQPHEQSPVHLAKVFRELGYTKQEQESVMAILKGLPSYGDRMNVLHALMVAKKMNPKQKNADVIKKLEKVLEQKKPIDIQKVFAISSLKNHMKQFHEGDVKAIELNEAVIHRINELDSHSMFEFINNLPVEEEEEEGEIEINDKIESKDKVEEEKEDPLADIFTPLTDLNDRRKLGAILTRVSY